MIVAPLLFRYFYLDYKNSGKVCSTMAAQFPPSRDYAASGDADAMLPGAFPAQLLQPVGGRNSQIVERDGVVEHAQLPQSALLNLSRQPPRSLAAVDTAGLVVLERPDHLDIM
jgi:hypothetical protein